jgi:hypothetical protein
LRLFRPAGSPSAAFQVLMGTTKVSAHKKPPCGGATSDTNPRARSRVRENAASPCRRHRRMLPSTVAATFRLRQTSPGQGARRPARIARRYRRTISQETGLTALCGRGFPAPRTPANPAPHLRSQLLVGGAFQPREPQPPPPPQLPRARSRIVYQVPPKAEDFNAEEKPKAQREPSVLCAFPPTFATWR